MKNNEETPDYLGGLSGMLPAEVLDMLNELLGQKTQIHNHGGQVNIYLINYKKEEIEDFIMENNGTIKH